MFPTHKKTIDNDLQYHMFLLTLRCVQEWTHMIRKSI